jgi:hypothetical protein
MTSPKREFDAGGQHEAQVQTFRLVTGEIKLFVLPADHEDNEQHADRMMCIHVFADGAEPASTTATLTTHKPERVWRFELCKVCSAMHMTLTLEQTAERDFQETLSRIMD